jgi:hypothetical protein
MRFSYPVVEEAASEDRFLCHFARRFQSLRLGRIMLRSMAFGSSGVVGLCEQ